uniref:Toll-like receptor 13 n=2 Tax=Cyprinodon variegatus TaxID=28743 RepID=A0A3Q2DMC1_CYPVA
MFHFPSRKLFQFKMSEISSRLLCFFLHINPSLTFSLKNCVILYQANPSSGVSVDCTNGKLETLPEKIPKDAVSIEFRGNLLQKIKEEFHYMYRLKYLGLQNNGISYVDDGSFIDLVSLKTLIMRHNELFSLTRNMFQGLSNIMILDLSYNGIGFIHNSTFQFLTSLKYLDLDHNMLKNIAYIRPLIQLPQIQTLSLRCNDLSSFETKMLLLNETSNLEQLIISGQYLKKFSITTPIFPYLQMIDLSHCGIGLNELKWEISDKMLLENVTQLFVEEGVLSFKDMLKVLKNLISLRHLRINMVFEWIRKGLFPSGCKLKSLRRLDLFQNSLEDLTLKLKPCSQLTELYLQETKLKELPEGTIHSLKMLEVLNVSSNNLNRVSYDIRSLTFLRILHLDNNYISKLNCEDFENTTRLTELNLNTNQIANLDKCVFEHLAELKHLDLSYNELRSFGDTFKVSLHKLEFLDISENDIYALEENSFEGLRSLRHLKMASDNVLLMQNNTFPEMRNLEDLNVSFPLGHKPDLQGLQHLENLTAYFGKGFTFRDAYPNKNGNIKNLTLLKRLTVTSSQYYSTYLKEAMKMLHTMTYLEIFKAVNVYQQAPDVDTFQFNPQLKSLTLSNTDMSDLKPELFRPIQNLQSLDLSDSKLRSLNFLAHANLSALRYLKLTNNEILTINETFFTSLPSLTYLDLSNNQFTCDCSNALFIIWVKDNKQTQVVNAHQYECSFPPNKQGTLLLDFQVQSCWEDPGFFCFIFSTCLVVLTLLASLLYRFLRQRLIYTFQRFLAFLYDTRKRTNRDSYQYDAFVSYNAHNEEWVYKEMLPVLEGEQGWKLCLHHRDFQPGKPIIENITDAIYGSRKTICVISRHYLKSEWCSSEIQMASFRLFDEQKNVLILLFLEDIPSNHLSLYYGVRQLVKKCTYLSWPKTVQHPGVFWQNVMRALQAGDRVT